LTERRLEGYDLVALLLDGKTFAEDEMVAAVGVTITGERNPAKSAKPPPQAFLSGTV
jgi:hypothetical protein